MVDSSLPIEANDRDIDPHFDPQESIYRRVPSTFIHGKEVLPHAFDWPAPSVLRSKYSDPSHALHINCCDNRPLHGMWGVIKIALSEIPTPVETGDKKLLHFLVVHKPEEKCYAHSEIKCRKDGDPELRDRPTGKLRELYLVDLVKVATLVYGPVALSPSATQTL